jgi:DNA repair exonuclease SbcCD ATPase subunit
MEENAPGFEEETTSIIRIEEMSLEETQVAEQLYNSAGLGPVVEAGIKDYDKRLQREDKLLSKVLGPRGSDIRGYGEAVAKRVAFAIYALLNKQYGGKVGDLRSYIMTLEEERDRANSRYDDLMGRVVGILGEEYKELRTDSKVFMERLTAVLGEDLKQSKIDQQALAERLADIDGLRSKIKTLDREKQQLKEGYESQITALKNEHNEEVGSLKSQIAKLDSRIGGLESERTSLASDLAQLKADYDELKTAIETLASAMPHEEIGKKSGEDLYGFLLKDSRVPDMVIEGVGKFIDFKKYLGVAVERGVQEACRRMEETLKAVR